MTTGALGCFWSKNNKNLHNFIIINSTCLYICLSIWGEKTELADYLISVALGCVADKDASHYEDAHLVLYYYFNNATSVEDEKDDVF